MPTGHVYLTSTLDGFIPRNESGLDWSVTQLEAASTPGLKPFIEQVDGVIIDHGTFQAVVAQGSLPFTKPVIVMSGTLSSDQVPVALRTQIEMSSMEPATLFDELGRRGWQRVCVDGSHLFKSFLSLGLIEDLVVNTRPVLIGQGVRLFGTIHDDIELEVVRASRFDSGLIQTHYRLAQRMVGLESPERHRGLRRQWTSFRRGA